VLALLHRGEAGAAGRSPHLVLTRRTTRVETHKGQICLPGGALDAGEGPAAAAIREVREEIGVEPSAYRIVGCLTPLFVAVSGFRIHPFVAVAERSPALRPSPAEVEAILQPSLDHLGLRTTLGVRTQTYRGHPVEVPFFRVEGHEVWGATAMVVSELLATVEGLPACR